MRLGFCCKYIHPNRDLKPKLLKEQEQPFNCRATTVRWLNEHKDQAITYDAENGDLRYSDDCQETFNDRYIYILDLLEDTFDGKVLRIQEQPHGEQHD